MANTIPTPKAIKEFFALDSGSVRYPAIPVPSSELIAFAKADRAAYTELGELAAKALGYDGIDVK